MNPTTFEVSETVAIAAPAEDLYAFIADLSRMGEISPECRGGVWESAERGVGATFIGANEKGDRKWERRVKLVVVDAPNEVAWEQIGDPSDSAGTGEPVVRWTYRFASTEGGTDVTEIWTPQDHPRFADHTEEQFVEMQSTRGQSMRQTLASLKEFFER